MSDEASEAKFGAIFGEGRGSERAHERWAVEVWVSEGLGHSLRLEPDARWVDDRGRECLRFMLPADMSCAVHPAIGTMLPTSSGWCASTSG
jgi:hypothetical protein